MSDAVRDLVRTLVGQLRDRLQQQEDEILRLREALEALALEATPASDGGEVRERVVDDDRRDLAGRLATAADLLDEAEYCWIGGDEDIVPQIIGDMREAAALLSGSGSPPGEGERANCRCAPAAPWRSDGATCPDWPGCGNPDWRPATPQEASGV